MTLDEVRRLMAFEDEMDYYMNTLVEEANKEWFEEHNHPAFVLISTPKPEPNIYMERFKNDNPR